MKELLQIEMLSARIMIPENFIVVTAYSKEVNEFYWEVYYCDDHWFTHGGDQIYSEISHWLPLPKIPKE